MVYHLEGDQHQQLADHPTADEHREVQVLSPGIREAARSCAQQAPDPTDEQIQRLQLILDPALREAVALAESEPAGELHWGEV